jgi:hypothetical protein
LEVFGKGMADALPSNCTFEHAIDLKDGTDPSGGPVYALSALALKALYKYLDEILRTRTIGPSISPAKARILFVGKANGKSLRLSVDHWKLIKLIILNRYSLPRLNKLRDCIKGTKLFTKIDLKLGIMY